METFTEEHAKLLQSKEWLARVDGETSTPYLMKFHVSFTNQSCILLVTDTKSVWAEVLSSRRTTQRWSQLNPGTSPTDFPVADSVHESWLDQVIQCLSDTHTLGGIDDFSFSLIPSKYSDKSIELVGDAFKWRWDVFYLGPTMSSEILSQQLIVPLVSTVHLAFTSVDPISKMSEGDLEKAIDKVGRSARRNIDTHTKNAIMRPRLSTTIRRMTALLSQNPSTPNVQFEADRPDISLPSAHASKTYSRSATGHEVDLDPPHRHQKSYDYESTGLNVRRMSIDDQSPENHSSNKQGIEQGDLPMSSTKPGAPNSNRSSSVTEPESGEESARFASNPREMSHSSAASADDRPTEHTKTSTSPKPSSGRLANRDPPRKATSTVSSDSDISPHPPAKKFKPSKNTTMESSDEESDEGERQTASNTRRGTRQPIKRGGRRF